MFTNPIKKCISIANKALVVVAFLACIGFFIFAGTLRPEEEINGEDYSTLIVIPDLVTCLIVVAIAVMFLLSACVGACTFWP